MIDEKNPTICTWWQQYMEHCQWVKGATKGTLIWYNTAWKMWGSMLQAPITPQQISAVFIAMRKSGRLSGISINTYLRALRAFTRWLAEQTYQELVPVQEIRCEQPVPKLFHGDELHQLFTFRLRNRKDKRVILMSKVIADCGLRSQECPSIRMRRLEPERFGTPCPRGERPEARIVPITDALRQEIEPLVFERKRRTRVDHQHRYGGHVPECRTGSGELVQAFKHHQAEDGLAYAEAYVRDKLYRGWRERRSPSAHPGPRHA
jgi:site-specific recombinase XerD